jgi:glycolate oxidase FAD binding subunit
VSISDELAQACGAAYVRAAGPADAVGGVDARWAAAPGSAAQLAAVLRVARERGLAVVPRGAGTKLDWGVPPSTVDVVVETGRLAGVVSHAPGEPVATLAAGTSLRTVDPVLADTGQRLALDPPSGPQGATVGGVLATNETGPLRLLAGDVRELVVELEYAGADGELHHATGADSAALCGSFGALGVVTTATLRLHPRPPGRAWLRRSVRTPLELQDLVMLLQTTPVGAAAVEADWPAAADPVLARIPRQRGARQPPGPGELAVLIEGTSAGVADRGRIAVTLLGGDARVVDAPPQWWGRYPFGPDDVALKLTMPIGELHAALYALRDAAGASAPLRGSAGTGTVFAALPAGLPPARAGGVVTALHDTLLARGGSCSVLRAPAEVHEALRRARPPSDEAPALRLKQRFDPDGRFAPGRLPGP